MSVGQIDKNWPPELEPRNRRNPARQDNLSGGLEKYSVGEKNMFVLHDSADTPNCSVYSVFGALKQIKKNQTYGWCSVR